MACRTYARTDQARSRVFRVVGPLCRFLVGLLLPTVRQAAQLFVRPVPVYETDQLKVSHSFLREKLL